MHTTEGGADAARAGSLRRCDRHRPGRVLRAPAIAALLGGALAVGWTLAGTALGAAPTVQIVTAVGYGTVLATPTGLPLYTLATDHGGTSTCTGSCLQAWPPLTVPAGSAPTAAPDVPGQLGAVTQSDGRHQVTYDGSPLYTFVGDQPTTVTGNGVAGFEVVRVTPAPTTSPTTTTTSTTTTTTTPGATAVPTTAPTTTAPPTAAGTSGVAAQAPAAQGAAAPVPLVGATGTTTPSTLAVTGIGDGALHLGTVGAALALAGGLTLLVMARVCRRASPTRSDR